MSRCTLEVDGQAIATFDCPPGMNLLDAAGQAGWELPHSCRRGSCESCRVVLLEGRTDPAPSDHAVATVLACQAYPCGNVRVAVDRAEPAHPPSTRRVQARLFRKRMATPDVVVVDLRFPAGLKVPFKAGQYLKVWIEGQPARCFSMANSPRTNDGVQLHVRVLPGSLVGEQVLSRLDPGASLEIELPFGDFYLRESLAPVLLVAGGTGFAPIQSLLEDALVKAPGRSYTLYWGARQAAGLYALDQVAKWQRRHPHFRFVGVVSDGPVPEGVRQARLLAAVMADFVDLSAHHAYVCGSLGMVTATRGALVGNLGLLPRYFFADSFVSVYA